MQRMFQTERIQHQQPAMAIAIHAILVLAYAQEAALLQIEDGGAFGQTPDEIEHSNHVFIGASRDGVLFGLLSLTEDDETAQTRIALLVVHPEHQRQGIARALLMHTLGESPGGVFSVVAAASNAPALALYQGLGFVAYRRGSMGSGALEVFKLRVRASQRSR